MGWRCRSLARSLEFHARSQRRRSLPVAVSVALPVSVEGQGQQEAGRRGGSRRGEGGRAGRPRQQAASLRGVGILDCRSLPSYSVPPLRPCAVRMMWATGLVAGGRAGGSQVSPECLPVQPAAHETPLLSSFSAAANRCFDFSDRKCGCEFPCVLFFCEIIDPRYW